MTVSRFPNVSRRFPGNGQRPEIPTVSPFPSLYGKRERETASGWCDVPGSSRCMKSPEMAACARWTVWYRRLAAGDTPYANGTRVAC